MFIDVNSIQVNNLSLGTYISSAKYGYHKQWGKDTGRNLAGTFSGTLLGVFPKITCHFHKLTKSQIETLAPILDSATQSLRYYDPNKRAYVTMSTYSGDWEIENKNLINENKKVDGFDIAFISRKKRT